MDNGNTSKYAQIFYIKTLRPYYCSQFGRMSCFTHLCNCWNKSQKKLWPTCSLFFMDSNGKRHKRTASGFVRHVEKSQNPRELKKKKKSLLGACACQTGHVIGAALILFLLLSSLCCRFFKPLVGSQERDCHLSQHSNNFRNIVA